MELRHLRHFVKVAEFGSITRAALALNMSQPSLSHSIKTLEMSLGMQLFNGGGAGIELTEGGTAFLKNAVHLLREAEKALDDVALYSGRQEGLLIVGVMSGFSLSLTSRIVARFFDQNPDISVKIQNFTSTSANFQKQLERSEWDVVLTMLTEHVEVNPSILIEKITASQSSVYCGAEHPIAKEKSVSPETLSKYGWATSLVATGQQLIREYLDRHNLPHRVQARCNSINQIASLVKSAPLLCLLPEVSVVDDVANGSMVRVGQKGLEVSSDIVIAHSNLGIKTPAMREFNHICVAEVQSTLSQIR